MHAGIKSTAVLFGAHVRPILIGFAIAFVALLIGAGAQNGHGAPYFVISCGGAAMHFVWMFARWTPDVPADGGKKFNVRPLPPPPCAELTNGLQANGLTGLIIWVGMLLDYWLVYSASA